jgi:hypothetical protein
MAGGIIFPASLGGDVASKLNDIARKDDRKRLSQLIGEAGFSGSDAVIMRAIILAESGGRVKAVNRNRDGTIDVGLAQINSVHKKDNESESDFRKRMEDPVNNLKEAKTLHSGRGGFGDWVAYNTGKYRGFMPKPRDPVITLEKNTIAGDITGGVSSAVDTVISPLETLANIATVLFQADTWARIGKGTLGGVFVILGTGAMVFVIANKASGGQVTRTAKSAAGGGVKSAAKVTGVIPK